MTDMTATSDLPLSEQFARAVALFNQTADGWPALSKLASLTLPEARADAIERAAASTPRSEAAQASVDALNALSTNVSQARLISSNEQLDEIATHSLKYLLLTYLTAAAHAACQGEAKHRLQSVVCASDHLTAFFTSADRLSLLTPQQRDGVLGDSSEVATAVRGPTREEKIQRYKAEKQDERRLQGLLDAVRMQAGATRMVDTDVEEDAVREMMLIVLQSAVRRALDMHGVLQKESTILQWGERQRARGVDPRERAERARPRGEMESVVAGMPASFRIVNERERERAGVFRPSHSLPTYTVEEWGEIEADRLAKAEREKHEAGVKAAKQSDEDSDDDEAVNKDTLEKRRWDDWKDDNNRGSGNTIR